MNQGIYKLVYSKVLNMFVPASEAVSGHGSKNAKRVRRHSKNALAYTLMLSFTFTGQAWADALPAGLDIKTMTGTSITSSTLNSINFKQLQSKAIVDWNTLNLMQGHNFNVDMQRSWSMLNRIHDLGPSTLNGNVNAAGNIYFINTNGIIFGPNAQFNVGSLYAGTLDITDSLFNAGFISDQPLEFKPVFELVGALGKSVEVQAGAVINTAQGGKVLLFSENVENSGIINTPDGQTILAAGKKVYLADAQNPATPENPVGFLVEVDSGGTATNLGKIIAERGNITIAGLAVNQKGTLTATTSVRANGTIYLQAQDRVVDGGQSGTRDGTVTLAKGSVTEVKPELSDAEEITRQQAFVYAGDNDSGRLKKSEVKIEARLINIDGTISAKGGTVRAINRDELADSSIYLGSDAVIDVSGIDATAPMSRNQLSPELFSGELGDAPVLRGGPIFRQKVFVDLRKGANGLFDTTPFEKLQKVTIAEALTKGGTIKLSTAGDLVINKGAKLDVSGGSTTYLAGELKETNLSFNGVLTPISEAKSGVAYDKTAEYYIVKDTKTGSDAYKLWDLSGGGTASWGKIASGNLTSNQIKTTTVGSFEDSYLNGDDAGKLDLASSNPDIVTKNLVLAGTVLANTKVSTQQLIAQKIPKGGEFIASANQLTIAKVAKEVTTNFDDFLDPNNYESVINTDLFANGFNQVDLSNTGKLVLNETLAVNPNGNVVLSKAFNQINADIIAPGSSVTSISNASTTIADGVSIITAGLFTNDKQGVPNRFTSSSAVNAGNIDLGFVNLGNNVTLDASAGAHVDSKGKLKEGAAGTIGFKSTTGAIDESVTLQAYGFKKGGVLMVCF